MTVPPYPWEYEGDECDGVFVVTATEKPKHLQNVTQTQAKKSETVNKQTKPA